MILSQKSFTQEFSMWAAQIFKKKLFIYYVTFIPKETHVAVDKPQPQQQQQMSNFLDLIKKRFFCLIKKIKLFSLLIPFTEILVEDSLEELLFLATALLFLAYTLGQFEPSKVKHYILVTAVLVMSDQDKNEEFEKEEKRSPNEALLTAVLNFENCL
ncbi:hypothetical protein BpHYR1_022847 [Brachionus plicatilis]|uniref:Uncharacterized protein n=1 Tax=Brachionus plicatilis TaxID=10195 RepID=A0A3M7Q095_BRAPC|nr:hypothetical protein BpHYR1_022847 [Brachionus plicatilis]